MSHYPFLVVGGGMTADAAVRGIRELDAASVIGLFAEEPDPPYARPPLSKALWKGDPLESVWRKTSEAGVELHLGARVTGLEPAKKRVTDDRGAGHTYDKLLLATGGTPRRLPVGGDDVIHFRTLADYRRLRGLAVKGARMLVVGGGFIGSEIAAALTTAGCNVTMIFPEEGIGARLFPADLARSLVDAYRAKGVDVRPGDSVTAVKRGKSGIAVETKGGETFVVDAVVGGIGIVPNTDLAAQAGLTVDDGIVVDQHLRTSDKAIFAAGDVARFEAPALRARIRVEHEDNALTMGRAAGRSMAGDTSAFTHLPFFYSDLFDQGYEAVGEMDPRGETVAEWKTPFGEGVVYYLKDRRIRGVLLWNTWDQVSAARTLISEAKPFTANPLGLR